MSTASSHDAAASVSTSRKRLFRFGEHPAQRVGEGFLAVAGLYPPVAFAIFGTPLVNSLDMNAQSYLGFFFLLIFGPIMLLSLLVGLLVYFIGTIAWLGSLGSRAAAGPDIRAHLTRWPVLVKIRAFSVVFLWVWTVIAIVVIPLGIGLLDDFMFAAVTYLAGYLVVWVVYLVVFIIDLTGRKRDMSATTTSSSSDSSITPSA